MTRARNGFTLVELIVVTVLGALVIAATIQVLITNQRTYTAQNAKIQGQQATRAALAVLTGELREVSAQGGDILAMGPDSVTIRTMRNFGVTCTVVLGGLPILDVIKVGNDFSDGDSVFVFADNDVSISTDDDWIAARITSVDTTATCGAQEATRINFAGQSALFTLDSVRVGAPVRSFTRYTYGLFAQDGQYYLGRRESGTTVTPIVGPVKSGNGVAFEYLDGDGNTTATPADVRQIVVTIRTDSGVMNSLGEAVSDSITARIYTRN